jgi:YD repeat-containing protein
MPSTIGPSESFQQAPVRNESVIGAQVYSHSGEFSPQVFDLDLPARGVSCQFIRKYRSAQHKEIGPLGRGWTFTYAKRIEQEGSDILYHDGVGRVHRFGISKTTGKFLSPDGLYAVLTLEKETFLLKQRFGDLFRFEHPGIGGRLLAIEDRNGNALRFEYRENKILIIDTFGRKIEITFEQGRVVELRNHAQRCWQYVYNHDQCLIEVIQPLIHGLSEPPRVRYTYDQEFRLASVTDPNGVTFLRNFYDEYGRIKKQKNGDGVFLFEYEPIDKTDAGHYVFCTKVKLKNGGLLSLKHGPEGHVTERTLYVSVSSLLPVDGNGVSEGTVPLTTTSNFNRHGELTQRIFPAGYSIEWVYDHDHEDSCSRGNLLQLAQVPAPGSVDGLSLTTRYMYESSYQQITSIRDPRGQTTKFEYDARGNLSKKTYPIVTAQGISSDASKRVTQKIKLIDRFEYNEAGQLIRFTDPYGASIEYFYYPTSGPFRASTPSYSPTLTQMPGGYLASIVRDPVSGDNRLLEQPANLTTGFGYDDFGNITTILDGKSNPTHLEYDAHNHLVSVTSRQPSSYTTSLRYDPNGNMIEGMLSFDHYEYEVAKQELVLKTTTVLQSFEYNRLNNIVRRTLRAGGRDMISTSIRDQAENVVRQIDPMGNVVECSFDERNQVVARRLGVGTEVEVEIRHTYTRNGRLSSISNGRGHMDLYHYDGLHRYEGFTNAGGTSKKQWRDEAGNVTRIQIVGEAVSFDERNETTVTREQPLLESWFQYDELNRVVRKDHSWRDPLTGESLGLSRYDGKAGVISSVVQYGENHLPAKLWTEAGNILYFQYDGASRVRTISDETGETCSIEYDENSNPVHIERLGPPVNKGEQRFRQVINQQFDALDRLIFRSVNEDNPEAFFYNALGAVMVYQNPSGASVQALYDAFGRLAGAKTSATTAEAVVGRPIEQVLLRRVEWDDSNRMIAWVNARGNATKYQYDALNRLRSIVHADGATTRLERDAAGNITRVIHPSKTIITNRFDDLNRLIDRHVQDANGQDSKVERFHYDGLNRIVAALTVDAVTLRRYDSLSRVLEETQSGRTIHYGYDSAGSRVFMRYPGGQELYNSYDVLGRVIEVRGQDSLIASYIYNSSAQLRQQQLGDSLSVSFRYELGKDRLQSIVYHSAETGAVVEGYRYRYDADGNCIQEAQLRRGEDFGERYYYDSAKRLVKVQYGVEHLSDPEGAFESEVLYDLSRTGIWRRKTTRNASELTLKTVDGVVNQREAYLSLGNRRFEYDINGNRVLDENVVDGEHNQKRYGHDYLNRLVRVESLDADGQVVQTINYSYDAFNRQVLKRITQQGITKVFARLWNGSQLAEELEDGRLANSFIYGARTHEPLVIDHFSGEGTSRYFYALNGRGSVTGLIDQYAHVIEAYCYDVHGQLISSPHSSQKTIGPLLYGSKLYDEDTKFSSWGQYSYDSTTAQTVNVSIYNTPDIEKPLGPYVGTYTAAPILMTPDPRIPPEGGQSVNIPNVYCVGCNPSAYAMFLIESAIVGGLYMYGMYRFGKALFSPKGFFGSLANKFFGWAVWEGLTHRSGDDLNGHDPTNPSAGSGGHQGGGGFGNSSGGSSGSGASLSAGGSGCPSGQPEDRPFGGGVDYGHAGGGSTSSNSGTNTSNAGTNTSNTGTNSGEGQKEHKAVLDSSGTWVWSDTGKPLTEDEKKDAGGGKGSQMPNPEDGTGEGIDKDWWRSLPYSNPFSLAEALKSPIKLDEREQTPCLSLGSMPGANPMGILIPQPITLDERGEHLTLNLQGVVSTSLSAGTTTSDGWGDKPRSLAEAIAAPRIRGASTSRF